MRAPFCFMNVKKIQNLLIFVMPYTALLLYVYFTPPSIENTYSLVIFYALVFVCLLGTMFLALLRMKVFVRRLVSASVLAVAGTYMLALSSLRALTLAHFLLVMLVIAGVFFVGQRTK